MDSVKPKRQCRLCGYPSTSYQVIAVPLSSPAQDNAVCTDCREELMPTTQPKESPKEIRCVVYRVIHESNGDSSIVIGEADVRRPHLASSVEIRFAEGHSFRPGQILRVTVEALAE